MNRFLERQKQVAATIAQTAERLPILESGLWFHDDIRNNFYYASYLFAAATEPEASVIVHRAEARAKAEEVFRQVLSLQNRQAGTELYGHWPLRLGDEPRKAAPNSLPVELMGSLIVFFYKKYGHLCSQDLQKSFQDCIEHIYKSGFFRKPVKAYNHHEAKYTAAKLIFGTWFNDVELVEDGHHSLQVTLARIKERGMPEYGCLPWFWHWVQAFACALEVAGDRSAELDRNLRGMLDYLWQQRALFYLKGAYVGAHSRCAMHDVPGDGNVLHDYVQFGDFELPDAFPRTEYAGLLFYEAPADARELALNRRTPTEVNLVTEQIATGAGELPVLLHSYAYITEDFAAGGVWERAEEYDNEQLRWCFSLPVTRDRRANQLTFFHPGRGYREGDPRHQSGHMEVLYHKNVIMALFPIPEENEHEWIGVLPKGEWLQEPQTLFGIIDHVYFAVYLSGSYQMKEREAYIEVTAATKGLSGAVAVEAIRACEAQEKGIASLHEFAEAMKAKAGARAPFFANEEELLQIKYTTIKGEQLSLAFDRKERTAKAAINGNAISFAGYTVL